MEALVALLGELPPPLTRPPAIVQGKGGCQGVRSVQRDASHQTVCGTVGTAASWPWPKVLWRRLSRRLRMGAVYGASLKT